jgi:hypothetical protein
VTAAAEVVIDRCPVTGRALSVQLPDGRVAFYQRREDDCMAAAVATLLQVHIVDVPDPQIDAQLAAGADPDALNQQIASELQAYLSGFGLRMVRHRRPPVEREGWLGLCPDPAGGRFQGHVVVMAYDQPAFDPAANWPCPPGHKVAPVTEIAGGITFDPIEEQA